MPNRIIQLIVIAIVKVFEGTCYVRSIREKLAVRIEDFLEENKA